MEELKHSNESSIGEKQKLTPVEENLKRIAKEREEEKAVQDEARKMVVDADSEMRPFYKNLETIQTQINAKVNEEVEKRKKQIESPIKKVSSEAVFEYLSDTDELIKELVDKKKNAIVDIYEARDKYILPALEEHRRLLDSETSISADSLRVRVLENFLKRMNQFVGGEDGSVEFFKKQPKKEGDKIKEPAKEQGSGLLYQYLPYQTIDGDFLEFDITDDACEPFGFFTGERIMTPLGPATVIGVFDEKLWYHIDGSKGASHYGKKLKKKELETEGFKKIQE